MGKTIKRKKKYILAFEKRKIFRFVHSLCCLGRNASYFLVITLTGVCEHVYKFRQHHHSHKCKDARIILNTQYHYTDLSNQPYCKHCQFA